MPLEDQDPEIVMNPVLLMQAPHALDLHRWRTAPCLTPHTPTPRRQMEKDARARRDGKKKGGGLGKSGGLARLGLKIEAKEGAVGAKVPVQKQVDSFLANMGVDVDYVAAESEQKKKHAAKKLEAARGRSRRVFRRRS